MCDHLKYLLCMLSLINFVLVIVPVLVNIAFITLLERKILGYSQLRKGPNKVSIIGILQPFRDAIKLFSKEIIFPTHSNYIQYLFAPFVAFIIMLIRYILFPLLEINISMGLSFLLFYTIMRINIYPLFISGWASNNKYALVGAIRGIAQTVSYEVALATILIFYAISHFRLSIGEWMNINSLIIKSILILPLVGIWFISCLAETNRTPFDFSEGESELVSGFNIEYGGMGFALIFMAEYGSISFLSLITASMFLSYRNNSIIFVLTASLMLRIWVWVRCTFPRYRYDKLINLAWKRYLPICLFYMCYSIFLIL